MSTAADRVIAVMRYRRLSGADLARAKGIHANTIARIASGQTLSPRPKTLAALAKALLVRVDVLTGRLPLPQPPESANDHLIELGCEMWQLCRQAQGWAEHLGERRQRRAYSQIQWGLGRLSDILSKRGIEIQDRTGQKWDGGDPIDVVNASASVRPGATIRNMLEPVVLHQGKVKRRGKGIAATTTGDAKP